MAEPTESAAEPPERTRWLWALLGSVVLTHTALNLTRPLISYRTIAVGGDAVEVGLITAAYALLPLVIAVPLGRATDRSARIAWIVGLGSVILAAGGLLLSLVDGLAGLALASTVVGVGHLLCMVAGQGLIARHSRPENLDRDFGWFTAAASLGQLAGPLISGAILADASGDALLAATSTALVVAGAVAALGALPLLALFRLSPVRRTAEQKAAPPVPTLDLLRRRRMPSALLASLALLSAVDILTAYLPLIAESRDIPPVLVGVLLSLRAGSSLLSRLTLPWMLRRWSRKTLIVASTAVAGLSLILVALPLGGFAVLALVLGLGGFLLGLGQPLTMAEVTTLAPEGARGSALALRIWGNRLGQVAIPAAASAVAGAVGAPGALLFSAAVLITAAVTAR
ncbi:MFS transporter [Nocardiopsis changdeensis]|uniref:MFS transporter n=1 Tax=Nocardiopsis changdeensis TaxID=2831969 RepID=A0ABX8BSM8_9ACTN|nr:MULTISPECIES: MFS transporter [Nocardiopsis]QUX24798.1 MFS transporter [Nocardiopsis changdeensis]QYX35184.1 MFS transporter [Nocardiopsis sp. MT53]